MMKIRSQMIHENKSINNYGYAEFNYGVLFLYFCCRHHSNIPQRSSVNYSLHSVVIHKDINRFCATVYFIVYDLNAAIFRI